jgi:hypothetical protein|tara:strand:+ start:2484 stop:3005 length:522 start_codon:yes stop_codon:yes gene_type:complete
MELETTVKLTIFNEQADSCFSILHHDDEIYKLDLKKNTLRDIKFSKKIKYEAFGLHTITLKWNGDGDCANKYFHIKSIAVNEQKLPAHTVRSKPYENDYIRELKKTEDGKQRIKQMTLYPGYRHGWYGEYQINFEFGDKDYFKKLSRNSVTAYLGIKRERIYLDKKYQEGFRL